MLIDTMNRLLPLILTHVKIWNLEAKCMGTVYLRSYPISVLRKVSLKVDVTQNEITVSLANGGTNLKLNITNERLYQLQQEDPFCKRIVGLLKSLKLQASKPLYI